MSVEPPILALRGSKGISFINGPPLSGEYEKFKKEENPCCRSMTFSNDGSLFSWCSNQRVNVIRTSSYDSVSQVNNSQVSFVDISPKGTYLSTWQQYSAKQNQQESCNLHVWNISTGENVKSFIQKKQYGWEPQWSDDEFLCARNVSNEVQFFENANFDSIAKKIFLQKVAYFSLAPGPSPHHVACYVPGVKGQPSFVRLLKYPNFEGSNAIIAQKSFFKAERTDFYWNKTGKDCIFLTSVDVDKSGASYYGELNLYYVSVKGDTAKIKLGKDGPVYSIKWSPSSVEFCVVYGYMPARATIYNLKSEPVFDFGAAPRNEVHYSPIGDRISLSGFGNLQGHIEVWDLKQKKQISKFQARDSTLIEWSYDGEYLLTATTSPRLRIGNGYRIWHYTGSLLVEVLYNPNEELYDIKWKPVPNGFYEAKRTIYKPVPGIESVCPTVSKEAYRPPAAQGKASNFKLHDEEISSSVKNVAGNVTLSKSQKKKLARKAKKNETNSSAPKTEEQENKTKGEENTIQPQSKALSHGNELSIDSEKDKKNKSLKKKTNSTAPKTEELISQENTIQPKSKASSHGNELSMDSEKNKKNKSLKKKTNSTAPKTEEHLISQENTIQPKSEASSHGNELSMDSEKNKKNKSRKKKTNSTAPKTEEHLISQENTIQPKSEASSHGNELSIDSERDKKIKSLKKKITQIEKLKQEQQSGKKLDHNQLRKINKVGEVEEELKKLELN